MVRVGGAAQVSRPYLAPETRDVHSAYAAVHALIALLAGGPADTDTGNECSV